MERKLYCKTIRTLAFIIMFFTVRVWTGLHFPTIHTCIPRNCCLTNYTSILISSIGGIHISWWYWQFSMSTILVNTNKSNIAKKGNHTKWYKEQTLSQYPPTCKHIYPNSTQLQHKKCMSLTHMCTPNTFWIYYFFYTYIINDIHIY